MRLLYDLVATQASSMAKVHGGGNYAIIVFFEILKRDCDIECVVDSRKYMSPDISKIIAERNIVTHDIAQISVDEVLRNGNFDAYYSALVTFQPQIPEKTRFVGTRHGLREIEMPHDKEMFQYRMKVKQRVRSFFKYLLGKKWVDVLLKREGALLLNPKFEYVTVSEHTKYSILSYFPSIPPDSIEVCYSPSTVSDADGIEPYKGGNYIMLVSGNRPEKNVLRAIKALDEIFSEFPVLKAKYNAVITGCGPNNFRYKILNKTNFVMPGYVDDNVLTSIYKGATIFVYPSLNEGFGYPPIEAMRFGVPVIASPVTSISEVCGEAALYFNPFDYKEIKGRLLRMMFDDSLRSEYSEKSRERFAIIERKQQKDLQRLVDFIIKGPDKKRSGNFF